MASLIPCRILARAVIRPSEDPQRVLKAILNIMPDGEAEILGQVAQARASGVAALDAIRESLASRQTLGGLRRNMVGNIYDNTTTFMLNRQAAYMGVAAVCDTAEESPLGPIEVEVESRRIEDIIQYMVKMLEPAGH